jgi:hypothetical protein
MESGQFREEISSSSWTDAKANSTVNSWDFQAYVTLPSNPCYVDGVRKEPPYNKEDEARCVYKIYTGQGKALSDTLGAMFEGEGSRIVSNRPSFSNNIMQGLYGMFDADSLFNRTDVGSFVSANRAFESLAETLTNHARNNLCGGATAIVGTQFANELYIKVHWTWLIPTAVLLGLCWFFFLATMVRTWGQDLWKSSPLGLLFSRVSDEFYAEREKLISEHDQAPKLRRVQHWSRNIKMRLVSETEPETWSWWSWKMSKR